MNGPSMASFALVACGVVVRRTTDRHRRLLTCATIIMTGPAGACILPVDLFGPFTLLVLTIVLPGFMGWGYATTDGRARASIRRGIGARSRWRCRGFLPCRWR